MWQSQDLVRSIQPLTSREINLRIDWLRRRETDDDDLVTQCRRGNEDAWRALIEAHQDRVVNFLYRLTGSYHEAADLSQETFLQVWRRLSTFRGSCSLSTWIISIALNTARTNWRRRSYINEVGLDESRQAYQAPGSDRPFVQTITK